MKYIAATVLFAANIPSDHLAPLAELKQENDYPFANGRFHRYRIWNKYKFFTLVPQQYWQPSK
jgi:hypothetical protein